MGPCRTSIGAAVHRARRHINRRRRQNTLRRPRGALDPIAGVGVSNPRCGAGARNLHTIGREPFATSPFLTVSPMQESPEQAIKRYVQSGEYDTHFRAWPGESYLGRVQQGDAALRKALRSAIHERATCAAAPAALVDLDVASFTRRKVLPMVQGLFPRHEQACILDMLERSVVFLTPVTIDQELKQSRWLSTAWDLANLFLAGVQAEILSDDAPYLVGLSEETTCYLSPAYFDASGRFDDFLVHEVAHIFHTASAAPLGYARPGSVSGCWRSTTPSARPSLTPARLTAAFTRWARGHEHDRCYLRNMRRGQCRQTTGWMSLSTSISSARPWSRAMAGNAS